MGFFDWFFSIFGSRKAFSLGLYGSPNVGKTCLANRISMDWTGEEVGTVSEVPHETREVRKKEKIKLKADGKEVTLNLLDMPGIATKVDYREFLKYGFKADEAQARAKEATKGIVEAIRWLDSVDVALVVMDATQDPLTQVNLTIMGNLEARGIPVILVANKVDLKKARPDKIREAFPQHKVVEVSALTGENIHHLYKEIAQQAGKAK